jgi:signal transduction histidine kinase
VKRQIDSERTPEVRPYFVRIVNPDNSFVWVARRRTGWKRRWSKSHSGYSPGLSPRKRFAYPRTRLRDYAIASHRLNDGRLLQVGRLTDSRAVLLAPLRRAFSSLAQRHLRCRSRPELSSLGAPRAPCVPSLKPRGAFSRPAISRRAVPDPRTRGESAALVVQLNTLLDRNAAHVRVLRETLDNLAHDLRTPLTRLRGTAELALQGSGDPNGRSRPSLTASTNRIACSTCSRRCWISPPRKEARCG